jgi:ankyrin repeat protein
LYQLIRHRADVNLADISGFRYTIHYTLYTIHACTIHACTHAHVVCRINGFSPLYIACLNGHLECARALIDAGAYGADFSQEILLVAEGRGHEEVLLIAHYTLHTTHYALIHTTPCTRWWSCS